MARSELDKFHSLRTVVEYKSVRKSNFRRLQVSAVQTMVRVVPMRPTGCALSVNFRCTIHCADDGCAQVCKYGITKAMISVVMGVEDIANWLIGRFSDGQQKLSRSPWEVGVYQENVIFKDDPKCVSRLPGVTISLPFIYARSEFPNRMLRLGCEWNKNGEKNRA